MTVSHAAPKSRKQNRTSASAPPPATLASDLATAGVATAALPTRSLPLLLALAREAVGSNVAE